MRHYGYAGESRPAKLRRGARLMKLELRERPGQLYYEIEYGRTVLMLGDERRGQEILTQAAAQVRPRTDALESPVPMVGQLLEYLLHLPPERLPTGYTPELVEKVVLRWFPQARRCSGFSQGKRPEPGDLPKPKQSA